MKNQVNTSLVTENAFIFFVEHLHPFMGIIWIRKQRTKSLQRKRCRSKLAKTYHLKQKINENKEQEKEMQQRYPACKKQKLPGNRYEQKNAIGMNINLNFSFETITPKAFSDDVHSIARL